MKRRLATIAIAIGTAALLLAPPLHAQAPEGRLYTPGAFDAIEISGAADVRFQQGANDQVFIEGGDEAQQRVELRVRNNVLSIDSGGGWKFWNANRLQVVVTARQLARLTISGAASVQAPAPVRAGRLGISISGAGVARFDQLTADHLVFSVSGSGDADVAGQVRELGVSIAGRSDFRGENLASRRARVSIAGVGDVKVWAIEDLTLSVSGVGRIEYWGSAQVRRSTSGAATVVDRGPKPAPP